MGFINTKKLPSALKKSAVRGAATVATAYVANNVLINVKAIPPKIHGPLLFLLGTVLETTKNPMMQTAGEGMSAYGALKSAGDIILPNKKSQLGLQGISGEPMNQFDWSRALSDMNGTDDVSGMEDFSGMEDVSGMEEVSGMEGVGTLSDSLMY